MTTATPFARPLYVMLKPAGARCNLACKYCYYLEKKNLYAGSPRHVIDDDTLELFTRQYIEAQTSPDVLFTWHGGEPLLRPLSFYRRAVELQHRYGRGRRISNCIQTNGTLLDDDWCRFFRANGWLVGISIDGEEDFHDEYRRTRGGQGSWHKVIRGIRLLQRHGVEWNAMAVVNDYNSGYPLDFYHFFKHNGCRYLQFTPIVERLAPHADGTYLARTTDGEAPVASFSVDPVMWGQFLCDIFDEWVRHDVGSVFVELFDCTLANWVGEEPGICVYAKECGHAGVMEHNGDVYSCDHFVFPEYRLGNIRRDTITSMLYGERQQRFSLLKHASLPQECRECEWERVCHGECPKNRFVADRYGNPGMNYLCRGYRQYFEHVAPYMEYMKQLLADHRPPADIMRALADGSFRP